MFFIHDIYTVHLENMYITLKEMIITWQNLMYIYKATSNTDKFRFDNFFRFCSR